jgi:hypothetical protein
MNAPEQLPAAEPDWTADLMARLTLAGVKLTADGENLLAEPRAALTDELRALIRAHKAEILDSLATVQRGREERHRRVEELLVAEPDRQRVAIFNLNQNPAYILCTVGIRGVGSCELRIPRSKYDPWAILQALQAAEQ